MGIRIHSAIGWGISEERFRPHALIQEPIDNHLSQISQLIIPRELVSMSKMCSGQNLLANEFSLFSEGGEKARPEASCLYRMIGYDDPEHHLFFPSYYYAQKWHRCDDDVDYAFQINRENGEQTFIKYLDANHYPFNSHFVDENGKEVDSSKRHLLRFTNLKEYGKIKPGVPEELRWWLKETGIMNDEGIDLIRPMIASWWS